MGRVFVIRHENWRSKNAPNTACTRRVGVVAFSSSLRGSKLVPSPAGNANRSKELREASDSLATHEDLPRAQLGHWRVRLGHRPERARRCDSRHRWRLRHQHRCFVCRSDGCQCTSVVAVEESQDCASASVDHARRLGVRERVDYRLVRGGTHHNIESVRRFERNPRGWDDWFTHRRQHRGQNGGGGRSTPLNGRSRLLAAETRAGTGFETGQGSFASVMIALAGVKVSLRAKRIEDVALVKRSK